MWSIGVTTYLLLCGDTPFNGKNRQQLFRRISCDEPAFPDDKWGNVSDEAVDFVRKLLTKDPANRLSAQQPLSHKWLVENNSMRAQPQQPPQQTRGLEASAEFLETKKPHKSRGSSRGPSGKAPMSPSKPSASSPSANDNNKPSLSRESSKRSVGKNGRSASRDSRARTSNRSVSRDRINNRSVSRDRNANNVNRAPPPPPKPQALSPSSTAAKQTMHTSGLSAADENARLLDVIRSQDAKIEKLERMVKRMLEPDGDDVHEC